MFLCGKKKSMRKFVLIFLTAISYISCKKEATKDPLSPVQLGKEIFEGKGNCVACHQPAQKIVGPSIQEIAKIYKDKNGDIVSFLKGNEDPIVDPGQYEVMKTNFAITKTMSDQELNALEAYIYSKLE